MIYELTCQVIIDSEEPADEIATVFNSGAREALEGFPAGEVVSAAVLSVEPVSEARADEHGWMPEAPS